MRRATNKGFTLIELIVVTTILGCLAAIAIPQYNSYREKSERVVIVSDCQALFRGFIVYFIENNEFPWKDTVGPQQFNLTTFAPLTNAGLMGMDVGLEGNIDSLKKHLHQNKAEAFDSPDAPLGVNQTFYLVLPWIADPSVKYVIAQSEHVTQADGTEIDGGNWLDGVYITKGGAILFQ